MGAQIEQVIRDKILLALEVRRLLGNPAGSFSVTKFATELKSQGITAGRDTLYEP